MFFVWMVLLKMSDVLDEVINRLPPSTLKLILEYKGNDGGSSNQNNSFTELLHDFQKMKIRETNRELKTKISDIRSKTTQNRNLLLKLQGELELLKCLKTTAVRAENAEAYTEKINEFKQRLGTLTKGHDNVDLLQLFKDVELLNVQIEDYRKKISEEKSKYQCYDGFPPDITEGKKTIARIKEKISKEKLSKSVMNSLFQP